MLGMVQWIQWARLSWVDLRVPGRKGAVLLLDTCFEKEIRGQDYSDWLAGGR